MKKIAILLTVCILVVCTGCGMEPTASEQYRRDLAAVELDITAYPTVLGQIQGEDPELLMERTVTHPMLQEMAERESNPIALFLELVRQGVYENYSRQDGFRSGLPSGFEGEEADAFCEIQVVEPVVLDDRDNGEELLRRALGLSALAEDYYSLESALLNRIENGDGEIFAYSEEDGCWYSYFVCYEREYACVLAVYFTGDALELQSLWLSAKTWGYAGCGTALLYARNAWSAQMTGLVCALEHLLAGQSIVGAPQEDNGEFLFYELPGSYNLGQWQVQISSAAYSDTLSLDMEYQECAELFNYRISR